MATDLDHAIWDEAVDWLLRRHTAPADARLNAELEAWCRRSAAHARAWQHAQRTWRAMGAVPAASADSLAGAMRRGAPRVRRRLAIATLAGALAAALLVIGLPELQVRLLADQVTGVGETRRVALEDGTVAFLDTASALAVRYTPARREVALLTGRAFFQATPNPDRPFAVKVAGLSVDAIGTAFEVRLDHAALQVSVQSGAVQVTRRDGPAVAPTLSAGDRLSVALADGTVQSGKTAMPPAAWRSGQLAVDDATVGAVVAEIGRYRHGMTALWDEALAQRKVTGVYDLRDPVAALRAVVQPHGGAVREISPWLLLVLPP